MDFHKTFDSVPHERLLIKLNHYGLPYQLQQWIRTWLTTRYQNVIVDGESSDSVHVSSALPQDTVLGPLMFLLYSNDIGNGMSSNIKLFADDCLLFHPIMSLQYVYALQDELDHLVKWSKVWQMSFNPSKCYILRISRLHSLIEFNYNISETILKPMSDHPHLGVQLSNNLSWSKHIDMITSKATNQLNSLRCNLSKCSSDVKYMAYTLLVRPQLEYASAAWDPYIKRNIMQIEAVQRRASRFALNCYDRYNTSVTVLIKQLGWDSLETRRTGNRLNVFYKAVHNQIAIPLPNDLQRPVRTTRNQHTKSLFIQMSASPSYCINSFLPKTVKDWNSFRKRLFKPLLPINLEH